MADGKVVISTEINTNGARQGAKQTEKIVSDLTGKINGETKKQGKAQTKAYKNTGIEIANTSKSAGEKAGQALGNGISDGVNNAKSRLSGLNMSLKGIATAVGTSFVVKKLIDFGKESVGIASDLQEVQNVVETAFGSMVGMVDDFASNAIDQFGMSELSAKRTASTYMAMSKGLGLSGKAAAEMAINVAGLTGDVASFYNVSQDVADTALKSIWTGETESLKQFGVVMTQANLQQYAYTNGITKSIDKMTQAEQVQLRYAYVTNQLSLAQGDFAKTSGSWANQTRILSERWKEFMGIIGNGLLQVLTPVIQFLNVALAKLIEFAKSASAVIGKFFGVQSNSSDATEQTAQNMGAVADATTDAGTAAKKAKKEAQAALSSFDELNILSKPSSNSDPSSSTGAGGGINIPVTPYEIGGNVSVSPNVDAAANKITELFRMAAEAISVKFAPSFNAWGTAFASLKKPAKEAFGRIASATKNLWNDTLAPFGVYIVDTWIPDIANGFSITFAPIFSDVMSAAISEFGKDFEFICKQISRLVNDVLWPAFDFIKHAALDIFDGIKQAWDKYGKGILDGFLAFKESLRQIGDTLYNNFIKPTIENIGNTITWLWDSHLKPLWDNICNFFASLMEFIMMLWNNFLGPLVNYIAQVVGPIISTIIGFIGDVFGTVFAVIADVIGGVLKALTGLMDFITGVFTGDWEKAWGGICDFFGGIWDAIWGIVKGAINLIIDGINLLWKGIYYVVKGIVDTIGGVAGALGSIFGQNWFFSMPADPPIIPKLAKGAVIPPNREFMAVLGDQHHGRNLEAPEELIRDIVREESGTGGIDRLLERLDRLEKAVREAKQITMLANGKEIAKIVENERDSSDRRYRPVKTI